MAPRTDADIIIGIKAQIEDVNKKFAKIRANIKSQMLGIQKEIQGVNLNPRIKAADKKELSRFHRENLDALRVGLKEVGVQQEAALRPLKKNLNEAKKATEGASKGMGNMRGAMLGLGLSVMFFGMALKRVFDTIWKSSTKVFQDVLHSVDGAVTGFDSLQSSLINLSFTVGEALEPIAEALAPMIDMVTDWVAENPKWAASFLVVLAVLGTIMSVLGQVGLLVFAVSQAAPAIGAAFASIGALISSTFAGLFAPIIVFILAAWAVIKAVLDNLGAAWDGIFVGLFNTFKSVWENIKGIFEGFIMFFKGVFTGNWKLAWNGIVKVVLNAVSAVIKLLWGIGTAMINVGVFIVNVIKDTIFNIIGAVMKGILKLAQVIDKIAGTNTAGFVQNAINNWEAIQDILTIPTISSDQTDKANESIQNLTNKIEVFVTLDGDEVADKTATRIVEKTETEE
jgi:hypothetical protein